MNVIFKLSFFMGALEKLKSYNFSFISTFEQNCFAGAYNKRQKFLLPNLNHGETALW